MEHEIRSHRSPTRNGRHRRKSDHVILRSFFVVSVTLVLSSSISAIPNRQVEVPTTIIEAIDIPSVPIVEESTEDRATRGITREARSWTLPMSRFSVTSCYEYRWGSMHYGIDFANGTGTPILAVGSGIVTNAGWVYDGYGISVTIDHGDGYNTFYAHASQAIVSKGQYVDVGQKIALVGSTGYVTGPHLHFGVLNGSFGNWVDPTSWLNEKGIGIDEC